jgi:AraC-like DNA-binding protein
MYESREEPLSIPAAGLLLCEIAERYGIAAEELFRDSDLKRSARLSKSVCLTQSQMIEAAVQACLLTGEPGLGFPLGLQLRLHIHRFVFGTAALFTQTIRDTLRLFLQLARLHRVTNVPVLWEEGARAALTFDEQGDLGAARDVVLICVLTGFAQAAEDLAEGEPIERIDLTIAEPEYLPQFAHLPVTRKMHFGQPQNRLFGLANLLDLRVGEIKPADVERIKSQCEHELSALGRANLRHRVLTLLRNFPDRVPSLDEAATLLGSSSRTLKRRLADQGTSYSALSQEVWLARAEQYLLRTDESLEAIAERLGFSDAASFIRAFRRWTGQTPARYRALRRRSRS